MSLPQELKLEILQYLGKQDLKAVRLVAKDWSACTSRYLFHRIYWSPQDKDIEVFNNLVNGEFAGCVKELVFDGSQFLYGFSEKGYFGDLCHQLFSLCSPSPDSPSLVLGHQSMLSEFVDAIRSFLELGDVLPHWATDQLWIDFGAEATIKEGYARWREFALRQRNRMSDPDYFTLFASGLAKLSKPHPLYNTLCSSSLELSLSYLAAPGDSTEKHVLQLKICPRVDMWSMRLLVSLPCTIPNAH